MLLNKEKLLKDNKFIKDLADSIAKNKGAYIAELLENIQSVSEYDDLISQKKNEFVDSIYNSLIEKIVNKDDLILNIIDKILVRLTTTDDGKQKISEILDKTNDIVIEHKKKSKEPWVSIVGDMWDDNDGKFKLSLDWNDSFISMLRKNGFTAEDESQVVELWLKELANQ